MLPLAKGVWRSAVKSHCLEIVFVLAVAFGGGATAWAQDASAAASPASPAAAAAVTEKAGFFKEPGFLQSAMEFAIRRGDREGGGEKNGFYPELGEMVTGAGWISAGPGYRHWLLGDRALFSTSAAISWRAYKMVQTRFELPKLAGERVLVGTQVRWHDYTQVSYWGNGPDTVPENRSEYRQKALNVVGYTGVKPLSWLSFIGRLGWLSSPELSAPGGSFGRDNPPTYELFPDDPVYQIGEQPDFLYGQVMAVADTRDHRGYPSRGGMYRGSWGRFSDRVLESFSFDRYEAEAAHFMPFADDNVVVVLRGLLIGTGSDAGQHVPFYLMPSLGGATTLRGYSNYRFHDRNVAVVNAETRLAIWQHLDAAVFFDAGNVAPKFDELDLEKTSYGVGVRLHSATTNFARVDLAHSRDGWNFLFQVNDPFRFARLTKRTAPTPFVP
jgi:hypothetical protein